MQDEEHNFIAPAGTRIGDYIVSHVLGKGSYGIVYAATLQGTHLPVAVKVVKNLSAYKRQGLLESGVLHDLHVKYAADPRLRHVVNLLRTFDYRGHICLVFETLGHTMHTEAYKMAPRGMGIACTLGRIRDVCHDVLQALVLMEECKVLHCDVKPENVMSEIDSQSVRLIDFGAVRPMVNNDYFDVQSLWYRAPEVLANQRYDHRIDVWSLGCMAVELWTRSPLFPGQNPAEQIRRIQQLANPQALARHLAPYFARDNSSAVLKSCFMDFVCAALSIDPKNRPLPSEAVLHPLFQSSVRVNPAPLVPWEDATWSPGGSASTEDWTDMSWGEIPEASLLSAAIVPRAERYHTGPDMGYQMTSSCLMPYFASPCAI